MTPNNPAGDAARGGSEFIDKSTISYTLHVHICVHFMREMDYFLEQP